MSCVLRSGRRGGCPSRCWTIHNDFRAHPDGAGQAEHEGRDLVLGVQQQHHAPRGCSLGTFTAARGRAARSNPHCQALHPDLRPPALSEHRGWSQRLPWQLRIFLEILQKGERRPPSPQEQLPRRKGSAQRGDAALLRAASWSPAGCSQTALIPNTSSSAQQLPSARPQPLEIAEISTMSGLPHDAAQQGH